MARRRRRHPEPELIAEGVANYIHDYHYKVYKDSKYYIIFDGRFAPFATVSHHHDVDRVAHEILQSFLDERIAEITKRAEAMLK